MYQVIGNKEYAPPPVPNPEKFDVRLFYQKQFIINNFGIVTPFSTEQFVDRYTGRKKKIYSDAARSLLGAPVCRKDSYIRLFGKVEKINLTAKPDPVMRLISPRHPRYGIEVGRYLSRIEHDIYVAIARLFGEVTVAKGLNALETGKLIANKWGKLKQPIGIGLDPTRFYQHVSAHCLKWEHSIYNGIYRDNKLANLLSWQVSNKVRGYTHDGELSYSISGTRMSGDMNTALGNCLIMSTLVHSFMREFGISGSLVNNGDDCVLFIEQEQLDHVMEHVHPWFLEMGFNIKVEEPVSLLEKVEFCQTQPVFDGVNWVMVRNPHISIAKDCLCLHPLNSIKDYQKWVGSIGTCGMHLTSGIPVVQDFYQSLLRASCGRRLPSWDPALDTGMAMLARGMHGLYVEPSPEARFSFYLAFGVLPDLQIAVEKFYQAHTPEWDEVYDGEPRRNNVWI